MEDGLKEMAAYAIASFIGCLVALLVFSLFAALILPNIINASVEQAQNSVLNAAQSLQIECSEAYSPRSVAVKAFGVTQYCKVSPKKEKNSDYIGTVVW